MWLLKRKMRPFLTPQLLAIMAVVNGVCAAAVRAGDTEARVHKLQNIVGTRPNHLCAVT